MSILRECWDLSPGLVVGKQECYPLFYNPPPGLTTYVRYTFVFGFHFNAIHHSYRFFPKKVLTLTRSRDASNASDAGSSFDAKKLMVLPLNGSTA